MRSEGYGSRFVCVCVCVCVSLSVCNEAARERYQRLQNYASQKTYEAFFQKRLRSDWRGRGPDQLIN